MDARTTDRLVLLGTPHLVGSDDQPIPLSDKQLALLALLAVEQGPHHDRRQLAALLWPDLPEGSARSNLRLALHHLRGIARRHGTEGWLHTDRASAAVTAGPDGGLAVDVADLLAGRLPDDRVGLLALRAPRGCEGYADWVAVWGERVRTTAVAQLQAAGAAAAGHGDWARVEQVARRLVEIDPLVEAGHELLARALHATDRRAAAVAQLRTCAQVLAAQLGIRPGPAVSRLVEELTSTAAPIPTEEEDVPLPVAPLPTAPTSFVGRDAELGDLLTAVRSRRSRLLSIVGAGGMGKTRLALEVATAAGRWFAEGAAFAGLDGLRTSSEVPAAIAVAVGLADVADAPDPAAALTAGLAGRDVLVVVDNAEHLLESGLAPLLAHLVAGAPHLVVLVTSRQPLQVSAEDVHHLDGLGHPDDDEGMGDEEDLSRHDAVRLLVDRLHRIDKRLRLDATTAAPIRVICRLLGGMPLGIEIAASAARTNRLDDVAAMLRDAAHEVHGDLVDVSPRHASLTAVYDWSVALLSPADRDVLRRLAVMRGPFPAEVAAAVGGADVTALARLCRASLLQRRPDGRHVLHAVIRQLAGRDLERLGALPAARRAHTAVFLGRLRDAAPALNGEMAATAVEALDVEVADITAAWRAAVADGDGPALVAASDGLVSYALVAGWVAEATGLLRSAVDVVPAASAPDERAVLLLRLVTVASSWGSQREVVPWALEELRSLAPRAVDGPRIARRAASLTAGMAIEAGGRVEEGRAAIEVAREGGEDAADPVFDAFLDLTEGHLTGEAGDLAAAERLLQRASATFSALGHRRGEAMAQMALSPLYDEHHDLWRAHLAAVRTMELLAGSGNRRLLLMARERVAESWALLGCYEAAAAEVRPLLAHLEQRGMDVDVAVNLITLGRVCDGLDDPAAAEVHLTRGLTAMERAGEDGLLRTALPVWGRFLLRRDRPLEAELAATRAVELARATPHLLDVPLGLLARALLAQGRTGQASAVIEEVWEDLASAATAAPLEVLLDCHAVLGACGGQDRAAQALEHAQVRLRDQAARIDDHAVRAAFLTRVPACREVAAAAQQPPVRGQDRGRVSPARPRSPGAGPRAWP